MRTGRREPDRRSQLTKADAALEDAQRRHRASQMAIVQQRSEITKIVQKNREKWLPDLDRADVEAREATVAALAEVWA